VSTEGCRSCGAAPLEAVLSLGRMPLANALLTAESLLEPELAYPLDLVRCPRCTLVQITETVAPETLFREYAYFSSFSDTFLRHAEELATRVVAERRLGPESLVVELASNDGYLLQYYKQRNVRVLGVEPARNVAAVAESQRGIPTVAEFFDSALAQRLRDEGKQADVVHAHNVLAHVPALNDFVAGIAALLHESGIAVVEVPYVKDMIDRCEFDTIYHEHLCYFSLTALVSLFGRHGLSIQSVERLTVHGGSLRVFVAKESKADASVRALLEEEARWGVDQSSYYEAFGARVAALKTSLLDLLRELKAKGSTIAAYGAAAKGTVLLNYCGIGTDIVSFVVDRSPHKQGRYVPGVHLPIQAPDALRDRQPAYVLLLVWNLLNEVLSQQSEYRERGGRFIVPVPEVRVV
jgi:SAM-dependent methyltransferase